MPSLQLAAAGVQPLVLQLLRHSGAAVQCVRHVVEHVSHQGPLPGLPASVAMDVMPSMHAVVVTRRLVRTVRGPSLDQINPSMMMMSPLFLAMAA